MKVSTTVEIELPEDRAVTMVELEGLVKEAVRSAAKELMAQSSVVIDEAAVAKPGLVRQRRVARWILTSFGRTKLYRTKVYDKTKGRYRFPADESLGLCPNLEPTAVVAELGCRLAAKMPYRQAASLLSEIVGETVGHRALHAWVQQIGGRAKDMQEAERTAIFDEGKAPGGDDQGPEIVVIEADGAVLRGCRHRGEKIEAKLGVMYTGKELVSKTAKHKRYRLRDKGLFASTAEVGTFAQGLVASAERRVSLSKARYTLGVGDGAAWIRAMFESWLPGSIYQLDHFHVGYRLRQITRSDEELYRTLVRMIFGGKLKRLKRLLTLGADLGRFDPDKVEEFTLYLDENAGGIFGSRKLKGKVSQKEVLVVGSGVVEKNIDIVIARRFKGRGMRWSRAGADRLLRLRTMLLNGDEWTSFWQRKVA